jgi:hypothetical protein
LSGDGKIDASMFVSNGIGSDANTFVAGEALAAGDFVYVTTARMVMKADAGLAKRAMGYVIASKFYCQGNALVYLVTIQLCRV